jgi:hypothetical protein
VLHGFCAGIMTIARGTLPLAIFDAEGYLERNSVGPCRRVRQKPPQQPEV